ncbi:peptidase domain-containing ABC transporter [Bacillus aquiflavi]|uniref:Peptidase domain-containing ABC transporter n=1 Tax=Bacillus aquiflavi TaxID=2672567 RepID=A0A6B3W1B9_9BACI|nr:peptidase domain-containing ABC transporter [Bacillus aquiflavi]MBA4538125.1 peptidase domain-containing ABC transporter [Bacillus aquiflavi]NEY82445.1 peptidase domain-containing ABC transporter [Bacillus aquiflavi]
MSFKSSFVRQFDRNDCAAACLATICKYYKKEITITKLRDILGTDIKGTTLYGLEKGAKALGFDAKAIKVTLDGLKSKFTLPAIAHIITNEGMSHFVVIHKITRKKIYYFDPASGYLNESDESFHQRFSGILLLLIPNNEFTQESKENINMIQQFTKILLPQSRLFLYSIIASIILTLLGISFSLFNKVIIDEVLPFGLENQLRIVVIFFLAIGITQVILSFVRQHILLYLSQKVEMPLLIGYFRHIFKLPMKFFMNRKAGDILTRFNDAFIIKDIFTSLVLSLLIDLMLAFATGVVLYMMNPKLFFVVLVLIILNGLLIYVFKHPYKKLNYAQMESSARLNSHIIEVLRGIETIKTLSAEEKGLEKIEHEYIKNLKISFKEGYFSNLQESLSSGFQIVGHLMLMYIGAASVMNNELTLGTLLAFIALSHYFMDPIGRLIELQLTIQEANISLNRLSEIYEVEREQPSQRNKLEIKEINGDIEIENVTFRYGSRAPILKDFSLTIPFGKKVALVGQSGSGKSTVAKLLLKYFPIEKGDIKIAGNSLANIDTYSLRKSIAYIPQKIQLFSDTIRENLLLGTQEVSQKELEKACEIAACKNFIEKLPAKYDTFLEEAGEGISGGEKQRIGIARALIKNSQLFILDEATSSIDFQNEAAIFNKLLSHKNETTMLIITHRLATIKECDIICVLEDGSVSEHGSHASLIKKKGAYYRLLQDQSLSDEMKDRSDLKHDSYIDLEAEKLEYR